MLNDNIEIKHWRKIRSFLKENYSNKYILRKKKKIVIILLIIKKKEK